MQKKPSTVGVISVILTIALVISLVFNFTGNPSYSNEDLDAIKLKAAEDAKVLVTAEKNLELANLQGELDNLAIAAEAETEELLIMSNGYVIDNLFLGVGAFSDSFSDREVTKLLDSEVEFDGEDYDVEELLELKDVTLLSNDEDMEGNVYLSILEGGFKYLLSFADLDVSKIGVDDEYLTFDFLGKEVTISEWESNSIKISQGSEYFMTEGEVLTVDGSEVKLDLVMDGSVYVTIDGIGEKIEEGETKNVNGVDIKANEVLYSEKETRLSRAELLIGEDVSLEIEDGDEYSDDSPFIWYIDGDSSTIGLVLDEDFEELDEDFNALGVEDSLCLPNEYACLVYNGAVDEDYRDYTIEGDDEETEIRGDFIINGKDSCDDILITNISGEYLMYDEDNDYDDDNNTIIGAVELEDSEYTLEVDSVTGVITLVNEDSNFNVVIPFDVSSITIDGSSLSEDYDYISNYGVVVSNTEDIVDDMKVTLSIPEERVEYTATLV